MALEQFDEKRKDSDEKHKEELTTDDLKSSQKDTWSDHESPTAREMQEWGRTSFTSTLSLDPVSEGEHTEDDNSTLESMTNDAMPLSHNDAPTSGLNYGSLSSTSAIGLDVDASDASGDPLPKKKSVAAAIVLNSGVDLKKETVKAKLSKEIDEVVAEVDDDNEAAEEDAAAKAERAAKLKATWAKLGVPTQTNDKSSTEENREQAPQSAGKEPDKAGEEDEEAAKAERSAKLKATWARLGIQGPAENGGASNKRGSLDKSTSVRVLRGGEGVPRVSRRGSCGSDPEKPSGRKNMLLRGIGSEDSVRKFVGGSKPPSALAGKKKEEKIVDRVPQSVNDVDLLNEGQNYVSMSMLVYIYAQLREMSVLGYTEVEFRAIDVNSFEPYPPPEPDDDKSKKSDDEEEEDDGTERYLKNTKTAGAIIRTVLEELELEETGNDQSKEEILNSGGKHDISIITEFKHWVEDSKVSKPDDAAELAIKDIQRKVARAKFKRAVNMVRASSRLRMMGIAGLAAKGKLNQVAQEKKVEKTVKKRDDKEDMKKKLEERKKILMKEQAAKGDVSWFRLQRRMIEDHFGVDQDGQVNNPTDGSGTDEGDFPKPNKSMIDKVIEKSLPSYFKRGSIMSRMMEQGMEVVYFGDRHPNEAIYCMCVNRTSKTVTVVFRGSVTAHNWKHNMKLMMSEQLNPIGHENYKGACEKFGLHTGFGLYMLKRRKDNGLRKIDEIFDRIARIGRELDKEGHYRVAVTGHSLGGAMATITSFYAAADPRFTTMGPVRTFTFAAPRVGCQRFRCAYQHLERTGRLLHARFNNACDIVPLTPPVAVIGLQVGPTYKHVGLQVKLHQTNLFGKAIIRHAIDATYPLEEGGWKGEAWRAWSNNILNNLTTLKGFKVNHNLSEHQRRINFSHQYRLGLGQTEFMFDKRRKKLKTLEQYYRIRAHIPSAMLEDDASNASRRSMMSEFPRAKALGASVREQFFPKTTMFKKTKKSKGNSRCKSSVYVFVGIFIAMLAASIVFHFNPPSARLGWGASFLGRIALFGRSGGCEDSLPWGSPRAACDEHKCMEDTAVSSHILTLARERAEQHTVDVVREAEKNFARAQNKSLLVEKASQTLDNAFDWGAVNEREVAVVSLKNEPGVVLPLLLGHFAGKLRPARRLHRKEKEARTAAVAAAEEEARRKEAEEREAEARAADEAKARAAADAEALRKKQEEEDALLRPLKEQATGLSFEPKIGTDLFLAGVGVRKKAIIKVYAVGMYVSREAKESASSKDHKEALEEIRSEAKGKGPASFVLQMSFKVGSEAMADALGESLGDRCSEGDQSYVEELKKLMVDGLAEKGAATKGTTFQFDCDGDSGLTVSVDGIRTGTVPSRGLSDAFVDVYLDAKSVSPTLKDSILQNL